jgi:hypothetical protein
MIQLLRQIAWIANMIRIQVKIMALRRRMEDQQEDRLVDLPAARLASHFALGSIIKYTSLFQSLPGRRMAE